MSIHPAEKAKIALLITEKMNILTNYLYFSDIFLEKKALILLEITDLNQYAIKLQKDSQLSYRLIYSLDPIELKTLKTYIEINLDNSFIWPLKSLTGALIFFIRKLNNNFRLCINY